jgi:probable HAF family extracellular repeat protein
MKQLGGLPGASYTEAFAINSSGEVVGTSGDSRSKHALLWSSRGGTQDLGVLPNDTSSVANAISDKGEVVGASIGPYGSRAFFWSRSQGMTDLGTLAGASQTEAIAINSSSEVVGTSGDGITVRAFLWTPQGGIQDLNTFVAQNFPVQLEGAFGINDRGQIIAIGNVMNMSGQDRAGGQVHHSSPNRMFLLTPRSSQ